MYGEAAVRLIKSLRAVRFTTPAHFLCIAANQIQYTLIDLTRRKKLGHLPARGGCDEGPDPAGERAADSSDDPATLAMWEEFHVAVAALPPDDRQLFDLLYYQGLCLADASDLLGVPAGTLKKRWRNAREAFMLRFQNQSPV